MNSFFFEMARNNFQDFIVIVTQDTGSPCSYQIVISILLSLIQFLQQLRLYPVIGIHKHDELSLTVCQPIVSGRTTACILLPIDGEATVCLAEVLGNLVRTISGSINDDDDLNVMVGLSRNAFQALPQILHYVVGRQHHAD